ncbi:MAG TPA: histidine phosphatase family protein [Actinomycetes bacterium]|nr:histidine phosphatase family protein [Actinomycetes bacterium]
MSPPAARGRGRRVVLWRHGRTAWNSENRFQGHLDVELDPVGLDQAERSARLLASLPPAAILSSDLVRAADTAAALSRWTGLEVLHDPDLRETYGGSWEGHLGREIQEMDGPRYRAWRAGEDVAPGGDGETRSQVAERAVAAIRRGLEVLDPGGILVVVTHGGTARASIGTLLALPVEHWDVLGGLANAAWSVLEERADGGWRLAEHNAGTLPEPVVGEDAQG